MGNKRRTGELFVYMNGRLVGRLQSQSSGRLSFIYDATWLAWDGARPISLSMPLTESAYQGNEVYNFFDNLLPDNEVIRERIQARFNVQSKQCFDLLSYIGSDCVGALRLLTQPSQVDIRTIQATTIDDNAIADLLRGYVSAPLGMARNNDFRISIAGAQEKSALLRYQKKWHIPNTTTPTTHIVKLPIGHIQHSGIDLSESVENEWLCLQVLSLYGLPVNRAEITCFGDVKALVVERFDRVWMNHDEWILRLPQEDMCQVLGMSSALKYESDGGPGIKEIMNVLQGAYNAKADREQFLKSVFLFWVMGAIDGHAKNFSVKIEAGGSFRLTPLYDVMSAYPIAAKRQLEWHDLKMAMAVTGKNRHYHWNKIQPMHWLSTAEKCQFPKSEMQMIMTQVFDEMEWVIQAATEKMDSGVPASIYEPIFDGMRKVKNKSRPLKIEQ